MVVAAADHSPWAPGGPGVGGAWQRSRGELDAGEWRGHRGPPRKRQGQSDEELDLKVLKILGAETN